MVLRSSIRAIRDMSDDKHISAQLAELRAEIEALKAKRKDLSQAPEEAPAEALSHNVGGARTPASDQWMEQLCELETAVKDLAEALENDIEEHPLFAVGAAFLLGVLIGRLSAQ
jgi:ElaB/YqjD/DUF883 family membrane-anchored ribosome-binding protein